MTSAPVTIPLDDDSYWADPYPKSRQSIIDPRSADKIRPIPFLSVVSFLEIEPEDSMG